MASLGFAVLHTITHGMQGRGFMLGGVYGAVLVFGWPMLALLPARPDRRDFRPARPRSRASAARPT